MLLDIAGLHAAPASRVPGRRIRRMPTIVVLEGDETGQELLEEALRVLDPEVTGLDASFDSRSLARESPCNKNEVVLEAAAAIREHGLGLKAATVTPEGVDDVGSPNRICAKRSAAASSSGPDGGSRV